MALSTNIVQRQLQKQVLAPQLRQSLGMLAMNLPELREALNRELASNPVIEDIGHPLEPATVSEKMNEAERRDEREEDGAFPEDDYSPELGTAAALERDSDADERRQRFFDSQTKPETLEEHLLGQLKMSDLDERDIPLAEMLIGELDADGRFTGSIPDIMMVSGESEAKIDAVRKAVMQLDPPGCCARTARECLLAQLDKLDGTQYRRDVQTLLERHFEDMAEGRVDAILGDMGISAERYAAALSALRTLEPRPGRAYDLAGKSIAYIHPEIHAVRDGKGRWIACVDDRSLPAITFSPDYVCKNGRGEWEPRRKMPDGRKLDGETYRFISGGFSAATALIEAVERRQKTITDIAQAIFDAQPGFFEKGLRGLRPLTMQEIAEATGVSHSTVSRTVNDKYASTPKGTVELRRFFVSGVQSEGGAVCVDEILDAIKEAIAAEDKSAPLSDEKIAAVLGAKGFKVARRTVAKYREGLGIPPASGRKA